MKTEKHNTNYYDEYVLCPKCTSVEITKVLHTEPVWAFLHICSQCGNIIWQGNVKQLGIKNPAREKAII